MVWLAFLTRGLCGGKGSPVHAPVRRQPRQVGELDWVRPGSPLPQRHPPDPAEVVIQNLKR